MASMSLSLTNRHSFEGKMFVFSENSSVCIFCTVEWRNITYELNQANFNGFACHDLKKVLACAWDF